MYSMKRDTYTCDLCGCELDWGGCDDVHGTMWGCERCEIDFCSKCFIDRHGREIFEDMLQNGDKVLCPNCYGEEKGRKNITHN